MLQVLGKAGGIVVALCYLNFVTLCKGISLEDFVTLSLEQKDLLDQLRERVQSRVPHDYMREDVYLIRWLRDTNFDVALAEKRLIKNLIWREENRMDFITQENWSDLANEYKWGAEGCDREGKIVGSIYFGDWDVRKQVVAGRGNKLKRYTELIGEEASTLIRNMLASGENTTQATLIFEMKNFNIFQHGCPNCIPIYINLLTVISDRFPGYLHKMALVNTPQYALTIIELLKPYMAENLKQVLHVYGSDKKVWQRELLREIDPDQLTHNFGGTREEATDLEEIRRNGYKYKCPR